MNKDLTKEQLLLEIRNFFDRVTEVLKTNVHITRENTVKRQMETVLGAVTFIKEEMTYKQGIITNLKDILIVLLEKHPEVKPSLREIFDQHNYMYSDENDWFDDMFL